MFKFYNKFLFIFIVLVLFIAELPYNTLYSQSIGEVYSLEYPNDKKIYFGPFLAQDSTIMHFITKALISDTMEIRNEAPTFIIQGLQNTILTDYMNFREGTIRINNFPIPFHENKKIDTIRVRFSALNTQPIGRKEAQMIIGFAKPNNNTLLYADTFYIIGKTTRLFIDGYDDFIDFDSVFINQQTPVNLTWKVRNTYNNKAALPAIAQKYSLISTPYNGDEFSVENKNYPIQFHYSPDNKVYKEWTVSYSPKDILKDTAEMRLLFQPFPTTQPDSIDTAKVKLYGTGVTQYFEIIRSSAVQIIGDTIDIGNVSVGHNKTINVVLRNKGNINYKVKEQNIFHEIDDRSSEYFSLAGNFCSSGTSLANNDIDSFQIQFVPRQKGEFVARYVIENDFKERRIKSNNPADYKKTFIIKGVGMTPTLQVMADTINFGNINSVNETSNCPIQRDTTITLFNTGNDILRIYDMQTTNAMFQVEPASPLNIPANSSTDIKLTFSSNKKPALYTADLILTTNEVDATSDTISLLANAIPPISATMSLPHLTLKPGTMAEIPITVAEIISGEQTIAEYASTFDITLAFNPTLLLYNTHTTIGTASAGCVIHVDTSQPGELRLTTSKLSKFHSSDTLLILQFRTFLGNAKRTEVSITDAKIGISEMCDDYISLTLQDGEYAIDSICGLDYKTNNANGQFDYSLAEPTTSDEIALSFTLPFAYQAKVEICNYLGDVLETHSFTLSAGQHSQTIPVEHYSSGTFYTVFTCGLYRKIVPFIKL